MCRPDQGAPRSKRRGLARTVVALTKLEPRHFRQTRCTSRRQGLSIPVSTFVFRVHSDNG